MRYGEYVDYLDIDAFEEAIGFDPMRTKGDEDTGKCPDLWGLHKNGDTTGKFSINREKKVWNCWVCGGGSLLDLAMHTQGLDVEDANDWIRQFADPREESVEEIEDEIDQIFHQQKPTKSVLPYFNKNTLLQFSTEWHPWYDERKLWPGPAATFNLCVDKKAVRKGEQTEAIIIPHFWQGKLVGWQKRFLDGKKPKYGATLDFPRQETIFNYDTARHSGRPVVVVESPITTIFLSGLGHVSCATFGAEVNEPQMKVLRTLHCGVKLAPDNDKPGDKWLKTLTDYLEDYIPVWHIDPVDLNDGADLGDLKDYPALVTEFVDNARLPVESDL